jgi:F0F1-type ATP synthase assembly protein I
VRNLRSLGILLQLGWVVAFAVLIPLGLGLWLDRRLSTSPFFIFIGAIVGILASTVGVVRVTTRAVDEAASPPDQDGKGTDKREDNQS